MRRDTCKEPLTPPSNGSHWWTSPPAPSAALFSDALSFSATSNEVAPMSVSARALSEGSSLYSEMVTWPSGPVRGANNVSDSLMTGLRLLGTVLPRTTWLLYVVMQ